MLDGRAHAASGSWAGDTLGRLHSATAGDAEVAAAFADYEAFAKLRLEPYHEAVIERLPHLAAALTPLVDDLRDSRVCLVHGDYAPKNILLGRDGAWILDAEVAHVGNPVFDLAFFLAFPLLTAVQKPRLAASCSEIAAGFTTRLRAAGATADAVGEHDRRPHRGHGARTHGWPLARGLPRCAGGQAGAQARRAPRARPGAGPGGDGGRVRVSERSIERVHGVRGARFTRHADRGLRRHPVRRRRGLRDRAVGRVHRAPRGARAARRRRSLRGSRHPGRRRGRQRRDRREAARARRRRAGRRRRRAARPRRHPGPLASRRQRRPGGIGRVRAGRGRGRPHAALAPARPGCRPAAPAADGERALRRRACRARGRRAGRARDPARRHHVRRGDRARGAGARRRGRRAAGARLRDGARGRRGRAGGAARLQRRGTRGRRRARSSAPASRPRSRSTSPRRSWATATATGSSARIAISTAPPW